MDIWLNPLFEIEKVLLGITEDLEYFNDTYTPNLKISDPRFGDLQADGILSFAKQSKQNPRFLAELLIEAMNKSGKIDPKLISYEISGPGFINFKFSNEFLTEWLKTVQTKSQLKDLCHSSYRKKCIVVDFSSPNTAKQLHVGHIRSTVIGESISRLLEFCGANVIRDNHIGDWGTQFGILIMAIKKQNFDLDTVDDQTLAKLEQLYKSGTELTKENSEALAEARNELVKLQNGDPENIGMWEKISKISYLEFEGIYKMLGVSFDKVLGESFYRDKIDPIYKELIEAKIAEESDGALVVFHLEHPRFNKQPFIIRKQDGASNYATTDLATIMFRVKEFQVDEIIYVVDSRQSDHFEQLFLTIDKWFSTSNKPKPTLTHVKFGTILGDDGKAIKTRSGEPVKLKALINEAIQRAYKVVESKNPGLPDKEKNNIARVIGLGAIRYIDLQQNRISDYIFSWDKMLSFDGNTAPYLLYAVTRIRSIFRKAAIDPEYYCEQASDIESITEIDLAKKLLGFGSAINQALSELKPHHLSSYLFELAGVFSTFYNTDKVIVDDALVKSRRLMLCSRTLLVLESGLNLLGLETLERM